jgi:hypothetical protein
MTKIKHSLMKKHILNFTTLLLLVAFSLNFLPIPPAEKSCKENKSTPMQAMSCCNMDEMKMDMDECNCPEMTKQDMPKKENIPAVPFTIITKLVVYFDSVLIKDLTIPIFSKRVFDCLNSSQLSSLSNKIYKKTNTFLI